MEYIDLTQVKNEEVNHTIKKTLETGERCITLTNVNSMHNICAGLSGNAEIIIEDSTGLYTGSFMEGPRIVVKGNVGWYAGDDMMDGELIIRKNTGCNVGAYICGGTIVIYGNSGSRVGYGMKGGTILVCGNAGRWAGQMAMGGNLILLGEVGAEIGDSMYQGNIFVRDSKARENLGGNVYYDEIKEDEKKMLDQLFETYHIQGESSQFHVIRPKEKERNEYELFKPELKPELAKKNTIEKRWW